MTASIRRYRRVGYAHQSARRPSAFTKAGFTLVEMLVVISIIAVLAALLLPAINMAREAARRAACSSNMRNLHLGIAQFEQAKSQYPASRTFWNNPAYKATTYFPTSISATNAAQNTLTWVHEIMPYIEKQTVRDQIESPTGGLKAGVQIWLIPGGSGKLGIVLCPSDNTNEEPPQFNNPTTGAPLPLSQLSYAINCGVQDNLAVVGSPLGVITGVDWPQNGVFDNRLKGSADTHKFFKTTLADIVNGDGAGSTILLADNGDLEEWNYAPTEYHVGLIWDDNFRNSSQPNQILNKRVTVPGFPLDTKPDTLANLARTNLAVPAPQCDALAFARPLSNHPAGFMVQFCDGHNKFISDNIGYTVYAKLMTSSGKKYTPAGVAQMPVSSSTAAIRQALTTPPLAEGDY